MEVTVENVQDLMMAADMLQLRELVLICGDFLRSHMEPSNCVGIYQFLEQIGFSELLEFTQNYIHAHFLQVSPTLLHTPKPLTVPLTPACWVCEAEFKPLTVPLTPAC